MKALLNNLNKLSQIAGITNHRYLVVVNGDRDWGHSLIQQYLSLHNKQENLCISSQSDFNCIIVPVDKAEKYLGNEFDNVIYDAYSGFFPNTFALTEGTLKGGGLMFLLTPDLDNWPSSSDKFNLLYAMHPFSASDMKDTFIRRMNHIITHTPTISVIHQHKDSYFYSSDVVASQSEAPRQSLYKTLDQQCAVEKILHTAAGHRNRPLVIISNRGHGKSSALGIACVKLMNEKVCHLTITGPRKQAARRVFDQINQLLDLPDSKQDCVIEHRQSTVEFIAPDSLLRNPVKTTMLMIDEAAALPLPMLESLLAQYSRVILSSTVYGYEGNGRGFFIRFLKHLDKKYPGWSLYQLDMPVRWNINDPLEQFCYKAFLLDTELSTLPHTNEVDKQSLEFHLLEKDKLLDNEELIQQIFGLLTGAHYKTTPNDLRMIIDSPYISIYYLLEHQQLLAVALISSEGSIEQDVAEDVLKGNRRIKGQLLPQTMISEHSDTSLGQMSYARIMRIAVNPSVQMQGIGSLFISRLQTELEKSYDFVGASYGGDEGLFHFWEKAGFTPVKVGHKRNAYSGYHSLVVIKGLSNNGNSALNRINHYFPERLLFLFTDSLKYLDASLVRALMLHFSSNISARLTDTEIIDLKSFAYANRNFATCAHSLYKLLLISAKHFHSLDLTTQEWSILAQRILQRQDVATIVQTNGLLGKDDLYNRLRHITSIILEKIIQD